MRSSNKASPDANRIKTEQDAAFYAAGIPSQFWKPDSEPTFRPFRVDEEHPVIVADSQAAKWATLTQDIRYLQLPKLVVICCETVENMALSAMFSLARLAVESGMTIQVDNAATFKPYDDDLVMEPLAFLYNVSPPVTYQRRQVIRDWSHVYNASFRVVACLGDPATAITDLGITPSYVFYVNHMKRVQT